MKNALVIPALAAGLAVAGCGGGSAHKTAQQAGTGYYNMGHLADAVSLQYNTTNASANGTILKSDKLTCFLSGPQQATCHGPMLTPTAGVTQYTATIRISSDGGQWATAS